MKAGGLAHIGTVCIAVKHDLSKTLGDVLRIIRWRTSAAGVSGDVADIHCEPCSL